MDMDEFDVDYQDLEREYDKCEKRYESLDRKYDELVKRGDHKSADKMEREVIFWMDRCAELSHQMVEVEYARDEAEAYMKRQHTDDLDGLLSSESSTAEEMTNAEIEELFSESKAGEYYD